MIGRLCSHTFQTALPASEHETASTSTGLVGRCCHHTAGARVIRISVQCMPREKRPGSGCAGHIATGIEMIEMWTTRQLGSSQWRRRR